jgi:signal transduction histidine kinase
LAGEALQRADQVARSLRELSHRLHPAKLRLLGLVGALQGLQRESSHSGTAITFTHENVPSTLSPDLTVCLFRIVQETLQNALKYSKARGVRVHLSGRSDGLALTIADDGIGFDVDAAWGNGLGLVSIRERVEAVGGTLEIRSAPGAGTNFTITVPVEKVQNAAETAAS